MHTEEPTPGAIAPLVEIEEPRSTTALVRYERAYVEPVRRLQATLTDVLDVDQHPDRAPEEALSLIKTAVDTFHEESAHWF